MEELLVDLDPSAKGAVLRLLSFRELMTKRLKHLYAHIVTIADDESKQKVAIMLSALLTSYADECERLFVSEETKCPETNEE